MQRLELTMHLCHQKQTYRVLLSNCFMSMKLGSNLYYLVNPMTLVMYTAMCVPICMYVQVCVRAYIIGTSFNWVKCFKLSFTKFQDGLLDTLRHGFLCSSTAILSHIPNLFLYLFHHHSSELSFAFSLLHRINVVTSRRIFLSDFNLKRILFSYIPIGGALHSQLEHILCKDYFYIAFVIQYAAEC